jgi:20S proteasome alpha/beta subunit
MGVMMLMSTVPTAADRSFLSLNAGSPMAVSGYARAHQRRRMTIIAAINSDDCLILAADSGVTHSSGYRTLRAKMDALATLPIAWGYAGDEEGGEDFGRWMKATFLQQLPASWGELKDQAASVVASINGRRRARLAAARVTENSEDTTSVLLAGYVGGVREIVEIDDRGNGLFVGSSGFVAMGSGGLHALIIHGITHELQPAMTAEDLVRFTMRKAIPIALHCALPARFLRIDPSGSPTILAPEQ